MKNTIFLATLFGLMFLTTCNKTEDWEGKVLEEEQELGKYVETTYPNAEKINNSIYYLKTKVNNTGIKPDAGNYILVNFVCRYLYDGTYERVSYSNYATYNPIYYPAYAKGGPELWQLSNPLFGISEGVSKMREQEIASFFVSSRYESNDYISRQYNIELVKVIPNLNTYQEDSLMRKFFKYKGLVADSLTTTSQVDNNKYKIFFAITEEGDGDKILSDSEVKLNRTISYMLLPNTPIYSDKSYETVTNEVSWWYDIPIRQILMKMNKGGKVTIIFPFKVLYGDNFVVNDNMQQTVPEGSVVIFEITVDK